MDDQSPAILGEGDTFKITAGWWNCPPCNVTWTYRAEPANAVPRLGVEVVQPIVIYQGQEVAPGEFFSRRPALQRPLKRSVPAPTSSK